MKYSALFYLFSLTGLPLLVSGQSITRQFEQTVYNIRDLHMLDSLQGWTAGATHWDTARHQRTGTILKTLNGGDDWLTQTVPAAVDLEDIHFADMLHGWAVGDSGTILHTGDGSQLPYFDLNS